MKIPQDTLLLTPGPVAVPHFVMEAISQPVIPHRSQAFYEFYRGLLTDLQYLFQTQAQTCCMVGTGTQGVEAAMYSLFRPGNKVIIPAMGKFSQRWVDYGKIVGLNIVEISIAWGKGLQIDEIEPILKQHPDSAGIILTHCETSTGVGIDLEEISLRCKQVNPEMLVVVDAITSVGVIPFYLDAWKIDCAVIASQKALMNPTGLCAFAMSEQATGRLKATHPADSRNLFNYLAHAEEASYPYTAPVQLLYGIHAALSWIKGETLAKRWNHSHQLAKYFRKVLGQMGGEIFSETPAASLTAFTFPRQNMEGVKEKLEREYGIQISGGQGELKGSILRVSHMGVTGKEEMKKCLEGLRNIQS